MDFTAGYAQLGDDRIAYQVISEGPIDVVLTVGWWGSFDVEWEDTALRAFYQQMASYARVEMARRGCKASDLHKRLSTTPKVMLSHARGDPA